jgi:O-antigen ligase/polysaccharide polymerase Wzy-like membrane protein
LSPEGLRSTAVTPPPGTPWRPENLVPLALLSTGLLLAVASISAGGKVLGPIALLLVVLGTFHRTLFAWRSILAATIMVIFFIPIKRYNLPGSLPIALEPYRLIVGLAALAWLGSVLTDPRMRLRRAGVIDLPLLAFGICILLSQLLNLHRVQSVSTDAVKSTLFFATYVIVIYLFMACINRPRDIEFLMRVLVGSAAVVAVFGIYEAKTGYNVFNHLTKVMPFLHQVNDGEHIRRGGHLRIQASAQHPIALGTAMALVVPLAIAVAANARRIWWWLAVCVVLLAALASVSRTAVVAFAVTALVFLWLRPAQTKRYAPLMVLPLLVGVHFALPGTLGQFRKQFSHKQLVTKSQLAPVGAGRLSTFGPAFDTEFKPNPLFGEGFGTRITVPDLSVPKANAPILDDQWLGILLETGIVGAAALAWLFIRFVRRMGRAAKDDDSRLGTLMVGITAAVASYAVAMFTFDIMSFIQVTFLVFIVIAFGCACLRVSSTAQPVPD